MTKFAISPEGAASLRKLAAALLTSESETLDAAGRLQSRIMGCDEGLGIFSVAIHDIIGSSLSAIKAHRCEIETLSRRLNSKAEEIESLIQFDQQPSMLYATQGVVSSPDTPGNANEQKSSFFETGQLKDSTDVFVKGDNYDQFFRDYYDYDNSEYISYGDSPIMSTIAPSSIEGIHLGASEADDPSRFWSQHEKGGTAESFASIAAHIPVVRDQLAAGRSLGDIENDALLGRCASIYFNPSNIPRVIKSNGYYEFEGNGRHRILAARSLGFDIPVIIVGERRRK